ncbi:SDR family NAD(P)-dependent oxidoreductase [Microvirga pudoricolor]|uniref:SDR family NAD(P)-dependent oxidoreductase n=1 Tax=Microvirga pudoricolor TaxID=2778729 RepID=UPI00194EDF49|nr:SDR family oxidoreductase [Microvirga pudoricolor]MBM6594858.1 SDR family oxidoreductase [Microvirga pudoricolor]
MDTKPIALVTGGAGGIGEACARRLAETHKVVVCDVNEDAAVKVADEIGGIGLACDVTSEADVRSCVDKVDSDVGPLRAMVMCAGIIQERAFSPEEFEQDHWDQVQAVNTRGTWLFCKFAGARMAALGGGSIVTISSVAGHRSWPTHSYAASKAAVMSLTKGLAAEWGRSGVRVNSISPGFTLTPRLKELIKVRNWDTDTLSNQTALGRWVEPDEIADTAAFLVSDMARGITGIDIPVDAGWLCGINWLSFNGVPAAR